MWEIRHAVWVPNTEHIPAMQRSHTLEKKKKKNVCGWHSEKERQNSRVEILGGGWMSLIGFSHLPMSCGLGWHHSCYLVWGGWRGQEEVTGGFGLECGLDPRKKWKCIIGLVLVSSYINLWMLSVTDCLKQLNQLRWPKACLKSRDRESFVTGRGLWRQQQKHQMTNCFNLTTITQTSSQAIMSIWMPMSVVSPLKGPDSGQSWYSSCPNSTEYQEVWTHTTT